VNRTGYSSEEVAALVRDYFASTEPPCCKHCGEDVAVSLDYSTRPSVGLDLFCTGCHTTGHWSSSDKAEPWESLHLAYLQECVRLGKPPRCPVDDSRVNYAEFEGELLEFRCPFCNRRGRVQGAPTGRPPTLNSAENESIVFLTG
jgi:hypothetical protein